MPIMAVRDQNDARGSARVLASTARRYVEEAVATEETKITLNNLYRFLEGYRTHNFVRYDYEPHSSRGPEALSLLPTLDRNVSSLRYAFDVALSEVYSGLPRDEALNAIEDVLRSIAFPVNSTAATLTDRERVAAFLNAFSDNLYSA